MKAHMPERWSTRSVEKGGSQLALRWVLAVWKGIFVQMDFSWLPACLGWSFAMSAGIRVTIDLVWLR